MTRMPLTKEQLAPIFDDVELMEQRIEQLEKLCRDLWNWDTRSTKGEELYKRMIDLGLLEGKQND